MAPPAHRRSGSNKKAQIRRLHRLCRGRRSARCVGAALADHFAASSRRRSTACARGRRRRRARRRSGRGRPHRRPGRSSTRSPAITAPAAATPSSSARCEIARVRLAEAEALRQENRRLKAVLGASPGRHRAGRDGAADRLDLVQRAPLRLHLGRPQRRRPAGHAGHSPIGPGRPRARGRRVAARACCC